MQNPDRADRHRVLLCVPAAMDAAVIRKFLPAVDSRAVACAKMDDILRQSPEEADAILISEEMLDGDSLEVLIDRLQRQAEWSDVPVLLVCTGGTESTLAHRAMQALTNVLLLDRPVHLATLTSALRLALRARSRQYRLRDLLQERQRRETALQELAGSLEQQVAERTELAEARARQLQALAVELIETEERERRQFAHLLHDDVQQMLAAAKMQVQAVADLNPAEPLLASATELLEAAIAKSRRLSHALSPALLHQSGLPAALRWLAGQMHEQFGLQVDLHVDPAMPPLGPTIKVFLFRAVQELLFNSVKHAGVKRARVGLARADQAVTVAVSDQGRGFEPGVLQPPREKAGFGLMSISERARFIGGRLDVESAPGKGSRFTLSIPVMVAAADQPVAPSAVRPHAGPSVRPVQESAAGIRVLFADDHQVMRQGLIQMIAGQPEIEVVGEAANGREALEQTRLLRPDVVVMDVSMPEMDGIEATRRLKAEMPEVRVIGLSMFEDEHITRTLREAGAESFVCKTASSGELLKAIYGDGGDNARERPANP